jgi:hypothetical protein
MLFFKNYLPGIALLIASLFIGLSCYKDYGISWDEPTQRELGTVTYNYVTNGDTGLKDYAHRALGTSFELPLIFIEKWLGLAESKGIYEMRHLVTHIFFLISVFCGYVLALRLFKNQYTACLAFLMLAFHPRVYAHSFFNSKDVPFLSAFLIAMLACHIAFEKNKAWYYLLAGIAVAYGTAIRGVGLVFIPCVGFVFLVGFIRNWHAASVKKVIAVNFSVFIAGFCAMFYASWPFLWAAPIANFAAAIHGLSSLSWGGNVLFCGEYVNGMDLPASYLPVWFMITVPTLWLCAGCYGGYMIITQLVKRPMAQLADARFLHFLFYLALILLPVLAVIITHSVVIDDWRHLYFIYPPFVMLALYAVNSLPTQTGTNIVRWLCLWQFGVVAFFMVKYHPFQQVYFNNLASHNKEYLRKHYDLEYWGCSTKQAMDYILAHDTAAVINVFNSDAPIMNSYLSLTEAQKKRVRLTDEGSARYFITNFRFHPDDFGYPEVAYEVKVQKSTIMRVYKLRKDAAVAGR